MVCSGLKVLIADDSTLVRRNIKKLLSGHTTIETLLESHSVFSTMQQVETEHPDVVIVDIQLPDGSGFEILEYLALQHPRPLTIVLTNFPDARNRDRAKELGADHFFDKSFEYENILEVLSDKGPAPRDARSESPPPGETL
jgi:DNA-binding NarL/FixJ family response regulator